MSAISPDVTSKNSEAAWTGELPDESVLADKTPPWLRLPANAAVITVVVGLVFIVLANRPVNPGEFWDHVATGEVFARGQLLADAGELLPLADGVRVSTSTWLADLGFAALSELRLLPVAQFVSALLAALALTIVAWRATHNAGSVIAGVAAVAIFVLGDIQHLLIIQPRLLGILFYSILIAWLTGRARFRREVWVGVPLLFCLWANCDDSFVIGLAVLLLASLCRCIDVAIQSGKARLGLRDTKALHLFLLTQVCTAATLLNPAGPLALVEPFRTAFHPNTMTLFEWDVLTLRSVTGLRFAAVMFFGLVAWKSTPRRLRTLEVVLLFAGGALAMCSQTMVSFAVPAIAITASVHGMAALRRTARLGQRIRRKQPRPRRGLWMAVNAGLLWLFFATTNFGIQVVHGRTPEQKAVHSSDTPVDAVMWLNEQTHLPEGPVFTTASWGSFLAHASDGRYLPMVNLLASSVSEEVWNHYLRIAGGPTDWEDLMGIYGITLLVLDKERMPGLVNQLERSDGWTFEYQDSRAMIFSRTNPI